MKEEPPSANGQSPILPQKKNASEDINVCEPCRSCVHFVNQNCGIGLSTTYSETDSTWCGGWEEC